jgi:uncharacterized membrane protein (UPF0127 family)
MPSNVTAKIKSAPKRASWTALVLALLVLATLPLWRQTDRKHMQINDHTVILDVASTPTAQAKGLGGRLSLLPDHGMLFSFKEDATRCFWMKDMRFPVDIVWLDAQHHIRHIQSDVSPRSYPHTFCPPVPTRYVIELNAGAAGELRLHSGQQLTF